MVLNHDDAWIACSCRFWKEKLRRIHGFVGPAYAFTDDDCMRRPMGVFISVDNCWLSGLNFGVYLRLVTLYQSVLAVEHDQENERIRARCYETIQIPAQVFTLPRPNRVHSAAKNCVGNGSAMTLHHRLGTQSLFSLLDSHLTRMMLDFTLHDDPFLDPTGNY